MRLASIVFLLGILILHSFKYLPEFHWGLCAFYFSVWLFLFCLGLRYFEISRWILTTLILIAILFCGLGWALLRAHLHVAGILPDTLESKNLTLVGTIVSIPEKHSRGIRFECETQNLGKTKRVLLNWYANPLLNLQAGQTWRWQVKLKKPRSTFNLGAMDYERWLFEHHIQAVGYVKSGTLLSQHNSSITYLRQWIYDHLLAELSNAKFTGFISGLSVGVREKVSPQQWQVLQRTGTNHLIAIAGLHVGFVSGMAYTLGKWIWRRLGSACLFFPAPQAASVIALIAAFCYSALAGFALPTQRAVIMLSVFLSATLLRKNLLPWQAWCLALLIVLMLDPLNTLSMSFWLSFGTVGLLLYGMESRLKMHSRISHWLRPQWIITVGIVPLSLLFFHQCALNGVIANAIAIPWVGGVVLPLCLMSVVSLLIHSSAAHFTLYCADRAMALLWPCLETLAHTDLFQWQGMIFNAWILMSALGGVLLLLAPRGMPARWIGLIALLPLFTWCVPGPKVSEVWFTLLDVGQGLATVVRTQHHVLVYDTGAKFSDTFDMGSAVVLPFLQTQNIHAIDTLVISHSDNDHRGGAEAIIHHLPVSKIISSDTHYFPPEKTVPCVAGQRWEWDGVHFEFLSPEKGSVYLDNDSSCVLRISTGQHSLLLPGDIEKHSERMLVQKWGRRLHADLLVAPHHGSRTSSTLAFIRAVHPRVVIYSVGYRNRYHFPSKIVMARYQQADVVAYQTDLTGALTFKLSGQEKIPAGESYREVAGRFWNNI